MPNTEAVPATEQPSTPLVENEALIARLRRIEGQVRGIARMLESERACEDVVTQLMAIRSSIDTVGAVILDQHLSACTDGKEPSAQVEALREAMRLWWRFAPSSGGVGASPETPGARSPLPVPPGTA